MVDAIRVVCISFTKTPFYEHGDFEFLAPQNNPPGLNKPGDCLVEPNLNEVHVYLAVPFFEDTTHAHQQQINAHEVEWRGQAEKEIRKVDHTALFRGGPENTS